MAVRAPRQEAQGRGRAPRCRRRGEGAGGVTCGLCRMRGKPRPVKGALSRMHGSSAGAFRANDAMRAVAGATTARMTTRHARLGGGVSWRECHGLDAGGRGLARAFTAPAPIFPRRSRRGRYDSAPAVPQEKGDEALALAQLFSRCLHVARRACGDHGAVDLVQYRGGVLSSVRVTMECGSPYCAIGRRSAWLVACLPAPSLRGRRGYPATVAGELHPRPATLPQWRCRRRHRVWSTVHAAPGACDVRVADLGATPASRTTPAASTAHAGTAEAARSGVQRAGSVAGLSHSRRRAHPHRVPPNADGRASRCRRRGPRIR